MGSMTPLQMETRATLVTEPSRAAPTVHELALHECLQSEGDLARDWDALSLETEEPNAFSERWFMQAGLRNFPLPAAFRMLAVRDGRGLLGLIPVGIEPSYGRIRLRHVQNWLHYHSFLGAPLVRCGEGRAFWSAVLAHLDRARWATGLLHIVGLAEDGPLHAALVDAARAAGRPCDTVHRIVRAQLASDLSPEAYYEHTVRKKKRKELNRLQHRLQELGSVETRTLDSGEQVAPWCDAFLALERSGWKGREGSALAEDPATDAFFREAVAGAHAAGRLDFLRLDLDGRPLAMLVNFLTPPGSFSFKIAFDEDFSRYSPGVLLQIENLRVLARGDIRWMDSCAVEDHPMINSLWGERRPIVRVTLPLAGAGRMAIFRACRAAERGSAWLRRRAERKEQRQNG